MSIKNSIAIKVVDQIDLAATPPQVRQEPVQPRWTLKRFVVWLPDRFGQKCCRETVRKVLKSFGFSWKTARKLLNKASPSQRHLLVTPLTELLREATQTKRTLVYLDEAQIRLDTAEG